MEPVVAPLVGLGKGPSCTPGWSIDSGVWGAKGWIQAPVGTSRYSVSVARLPEPLSFVGNRTMARRQRHGTWSASHKL